MKRATAEPAGFLSTWLTRQIVSSAQQLVSAQRARPALAEGVTDILQRFPIQEWEADRWMRGLKLRLIRMEQYFFRAGSEKSSATSLFVRNEAGLNVGLRREAITQLATFVSLVTDFGYDRHLTRFESRCMDVAVYDRSRRTWLYAENKASARVVEKLCARLERDFDEGLPEIVLTEDVRSVDDAVMKAQHILRHRPKYFCGIAPTVRYVYSVRYSGGGFRLERIEQIPDVFFFDQQSAVEF